MPDVDYVAAFLVWIVLAPIWLLGAVFITIPIAFLLGALNLLVEVAVLLAGKSLNAYPKRLRFLNRWGSRYWQWVNRSIRWAVSGPDTGDFLPPLTPP